MFPTKPLKVFHETLLLSETVSFMCVSIYITVNCVVVVDFSIRNESTLDLPPVNVCKNC